MTPEDKAALTALVARLPRWSRVGLLSPSPEERALFPGATILTRNDWDLGRRTSHHFDLVVACNVLMYADEPDAWLSNVLASTAYFLFINPVRRQRGPNGELGADGDASRTSFAGETCRVERVHALESLGERLLAARLFSGGQNEFGDSLHVIAFVRGELQAPKVWLRHLSRLEGQSQALDTAYELLTELQHQELAVLVGTRASSEGTLTRLTSFLRGGAEPILELSLNPLLPRSWSPITLFSSGEHARFADQARKDSEAIQSALGREIRGIGLDGAPSRKMRQRLRNVGFSFALGPEVASDHDPGLPILPSPALHSLPKARWSGAPAPVVAIDLDAPRTWDGQLDALADLRRARLAEAEELRAMLAR